MNPSNNDYWVPLSDEGLKEFEAPIRDVATTPQYLRPIDTFALPMLAGEFREGDAQARCGVETRALPVFSQRSAQQ